MTFASCHRGRWLGVIGDFRQGEGWLGTGVTGVPDEVHFVC